MVFRQDAIRTSTVLACSRLSDNGGERTIGASVENKLSGDWGWRGGGWGEGRGRRACETFFTDPLPPTFVTYLDNWISAVKMSIGQFTEIVLGFLARVVRENPVREQVTIVMFEKSFFQSRCPPFKVLLILQEKRNMDRNKDSTRFFI